MKAKETRSKPHMKFHLWPRKMRKGVLSFYAKREESHDGRSNLFWLGYGGGKETHESRIGEDAFEALRRDARANHEMCR